MYHNSLVCGLRYIFSFHHLIPDCFCRYLYWSDWGLDSRIERANLDGSERAQYIYTNMAKPWGLTIDYRSHYLYWCDMELRKIEAVSLLFYKRIVVVAEAGVQPVSVTVFNQNIYWIDG